MRSLSSLYVFITLITCMTINSQVFAETPAETTQTPVSNSDNKIERILVWGDSLSAAYGIPVEKGWVNLLQNKLNEQNDQAESAAIEVINGSISGETTAGGLSRLADALELHQPDIVILELGANDGLRGISLKTMRDNLQAMITLAKDNDAQVLLTGIILPPNFGPAFMEQFTKAYKTLADDNDLPFLPFLLEGVALDFDLMQADGLHPNVKAQPKILDNVWDVLEPIL